MSEKIIYNTKTRKEKGSHRLIIKNGIQYTISITRNLKHKFKTIKPFKTKKWIIQKVLLDNFEVVNKKEIELIIKADPKEQQSYDSAFALDLNETYELNLTNKQYETFTRFLQAFELNLNDKFYILRKGKGLKTIIEFNILESDDDTKGAD